MAVGAYGGILCEQVGVSSSRIFMELQFICLNLTRKLSETVFHVRLINCEVRSMTVQKHEHLEP